MVFKSIFSKKRLSKISIGQKEPDPSVHVYFSPVGEQQIDSKAIRPPSELLLLKSPQVSPDVDEKPWLDQDQSLLQYDRAVYEIEITRLKIGQTLGKGNFGTVMKAELEYPGVATPSLTVAVKCIKDKGNLEQFKSLSAEIKLLATLGHHPNLVSLVGATTTHLEQRKLYMVLEYCPGGDLRRFLHIHRSCFVNTEEDDFYTSRDSKREPKLNSQEDYAVPSKFFKFKSKQAKAGSQDGIVCEEGVRGQLTLRDLKIFAHQIANGMEFLHSRCCIHRDLAARNVLVGAGNVLKINDLGLAKDVYKYTGQAYKRKANSKRQIPYKWMAPECFKYQRFDRETDIWSYGILLWELFSLGEKPYSDINCNCKIPEFIAKLENGLHPGRPAYADDEMFELMINCWDADPNNRPHFSAIKTQLQEKLPIKAVAYLESTPTMLIIANPQTTVKLPDLVPAAEKRSPPPLPARPKHLFSS